MTKEALKLALEALETLMIERGSIYDQAITAIKEALAQPEQEPVVWMMPDGQIVNKWALQFYGGQVGKPLYTTPPQRTWTKLTDEEIYSLADSLEIWNEDDEEWILDPNTFARAIEAKLKEKNT